MEEPELERLAMALPINKAASGWIIAGAPWMARGEFQLWDVIGRAA